MESENAVIGDQSTEFPVTQMPVDALAAEKNAARFSRSKEFQALKEHLETRIAFFQSYLPGGEPVLGEKDLSLEEIGQKWMIANAIIGEFQSVIDVYERAQEAVKNDARQKNAR